MEIEKEVDWLAENILAYERCWDYDELLVNQRVLKIGGFFLPVRGFKDKDELLTNHQSLDLLFAAHQHLPSLAGVWGLQIW